MKMLSQRGPKMLSELFEGIFECLRIKEKPERKFEGHICNIKLEKSKFMRPSMFLDLVSHYTVLWLKIVEK